MNEIQIQVKANAQGLNFSTKGTFVSKGEKHYRVGDKKGHKNGLVY